MVLFSISIVAILLAGCLVAAWKENKKLSTILIIVTLILDIMSGVMILVEHNRQKEHYDKAVQKIERELKKGNSAEVIAAINKVYQQELEGSIGADLLLTIDTNVRKKESFSSPKQ